MIEIIVIAALIVAAIVNVTALLIVGSRLGDVCEEVNDFAESIDTLGENCGRWADAAEHQAADIGKAVAALPKSRAKRPALPERHDVILPSPRDAMREDGESA